MRAHLLRRVTATTAGLLGAFAVLAASTVVALPQTATAATTSTCGPARYKPDGTAWRCTFADGFTGTRLNRKKWRPVTTKESGYHINKDCYFDSARNIAVRNGTLRLTTRTTSKPIRCRSTTGSYSSTKTAGSISSINLFSQTYGQFEARLRLPGNTTAGTHSAWWMLPTSKAYGQWPWAGEIDIAEFYSQYPDRVIPQLHYVPQQDDGVAARSNYYCMIAKPTDWHTYNLVWTPTTLTISYDGVPCLTYALKPAKSQSGLRLAAGKPFDKPFMLNLTQGVGLGDNAPTSRTAFPATMIVDYVRAWS